MAGLGDLLGKLFGGQNATAPQAEKSTTLSRVAEAMTTALSANPAIPVTFAQFPKSLASLVENRDAVVAALQDGNVVEAARLSSGLEDDAVENIGAGVKLVSDALAGQTARAQLEALIGVPIPASATTTSAVLNQLALLTQANEAIQAISIAGEIASVGQVDRVGAELRSYLDYSGVSQISGFGYGQILGTVIGARMSQEMLSVTRPSIPSVLDLATMRMREYIDPAEYGDYMARLGYPDTVSEELYGISQYYPVAQDWIRFAVRDVFNPVVVESAGLDEQFPDAILPYALKGGVSEEHMRMQWRAHWNLPSPNQAFEMLHRGYIDIDDLRQLLKSADYAPGYVEALIGIAYSPYTRVDARRMWSLGVLDDEGFVRAMREIGYDDEHAENLLKFVKASDIEAAKDLTQSQMLKAYALGKTPKADVISYLKKIGYDDEESALIVALEDSKIEQSKIDDVIDLLDWYYVRGEVSDAEYLAEVNTLGIPLLKAEMYLAKAQAKYEKNAKLPTKAEVEKWYKADRITQSETISYLTRMGYQETERALYVDEWTEEKESTSQES